MLIFKALAARLGPSSSNNYLSFTPSPHSHYLIVALWASRCRIQTSCGLIATLVSLYIFTGKEDDEGNVHELNLKLTSFIFFLWGVVILVQAIGDELFVRIIDRLMCCCVFFNREEVTKDESDDSEEEDINLDDLRATSGRAVGKKANANANAIAKKRGKEKKKEEEGERSNNKVNERALRSFRASLALCSRFARALLALRSSPFSFN